MKKCKHERVDTNKLYLESTGTCNDCGEVVKFVKIPVERYEELLKFKITLGK